MDRLHDAGDNGEAMFKHLRAKQPRHQRVVRAREGHRRTGSGWPHEGFEDRMVAHGSLEWRVLMMHCRHLLSSHADFAVTRPPAIEDIRILDWKFTFLQHGVIMFDLSNWLNQKAIDVFVTSTDGGVPLHRRRRHAVPVHHPGGRAHRDAALGPAAASSAEQLRHGRARDLILVAPTWRNWLLPPLVPGSQKRPLDLVGARERLLPQLEGLPHRRAAGEAARPTTGCPSASCRTPTCSRSWRTSTSRPTSRRSPTPTTTSRS